MKTNKFFSTIKNLYRTWSFNNRFSSVRWRWPYYDIKYGISNLFKYFKIVWRDRDWDYIHFIELIDFKLAYMEKQFREHGNHTRAEFDADNIHKTRLAIKRILDDDYHDLIYRQHDKKWGEATYDFIPCSYDENDKPKFFTMNSIRENANTDKLKEQESIEYKRLVFRPDYLKKQDLEYVTKMINKYLFHWWD